MSKRRPATGALRDKAQHQAAWRPIPLVQVDIDVPANSLSLQAASSGRIWMEAVRRGQVVGILEAYAGPDGIPPADLKELVSTFSDSTTWDTNPIPDEALPSASVVVPTICRIPDELVRTVDSLLAMEYPDFEVVVVDNRPGSTNKALPDFSDPERVRVVAEPMPGISAARNRGIAVSSGDFVAFTDDDAVVDSQWLRILGSTFALDRDVDAIGGLVLPTGLDTEPQLWFEEFYGGFSRSFRAEKLRLRSLVGTDDLFPYAPGRFGAGCNMAIRRSTAERMGGFNVALGTGTLARGGEDLAMFIELIVSGGVLAFEPAAVVRHSHRRSQREFLHQVFSYGTGLTAMYTAIIARDRKHLVGLLRRIPAGLRLLTRPRGERSPSRTPSYPRRTLLYQVLGMAYGPVAYLRSRSRSSRATRTG
jgi:glycosyltransferase involved in cell wall biosynthesis